MSSGVGLIVVAAGSSRRMGETDKVWADLGGQPVICHSVRRLAPLATHVAIVVRPDRIDQAQSVLSNFAPSVRIVAGGAERRHSVARGLDAIGENVTSIAVHDAARPFVPSAILVEGLSRLESADGAVPALTPAATVKSVAGDRVAGTLDRSSLRLAQTPQIFRASVLRRVYAGIDLDATGATDDAALAEATGLNIVVYPGAEQNFKITTPYDLAVARALLDAGIIQ